MARAKELWLPPLMMWTHCPEGNDYVYAEKIMRTFPPDTLRVHHYQGWWYTDKDGTVIRDIGLVHGGTPTPPDVIASVRGALDASPELRRMYVASPGHRIMWVQPLVRDQGNVSVNIKT